MENPSGAKVRRKRNIRRLAGVNRRITKLCNELESLQQMQGVLQRDLEQDRVARAGRGPKRRSGST